MSAKDNIENRLQELGRAIGGGDSVADEVMSRIDAGSVRCERGSSGKLLVRRLVMNRFTKFAAAAVIIIAVLLGLNLINMPGDGSGVVWAEVAERVTKAESFMYRIKMTMTGYPGLPEDKEIETISKIMISARHGMKMEMTVVTGEKRTTQEMYMLPAQKVMVSIVPEAKKYMRLEFNDEMVANWKQQSQDPREFFSHLMDSEYAELGRKTINGVETEGIEVRDPAFMAMFGDATIRVWTDVKGGWPMLMEYDITLNDDQMQMQMAMDDYQWGVELDAAEFEPDIPEDYELMNLKMPKMDVESAVEGLKKFAELVGRYPKELNSMSLSQEMAEGMARKRRAERKKRKAEPGDEGNRETSDQVTKAVVEDMMIAQGALMFYMRLVQEKKDPAYYGETVDVGDGDAVLMRWKADEQYQVIYGDLRVEDVSAEELAQLEGAMAAP